MTAIRADGCIIEAHLWDRNYLDLVKPAATARSWFNAPPLGDEVVLKAQRKAFFNSLLERFKPTLVVREQSRFTSP